MRVLNVFFTLQPDMGAFVRAGETLNEAKVKCCETVGGTERN